MSVEEAPDEQINSDEWSGTGVVETIMTVNDVPRFPLRPQVQMSPGAPFTNMV